MINELQGSPQTVKQFAPTGKLENKNIAINKELKNISRNGFAVLNSYI